MSKFLIAVGIVLAAGLAGCAGMDRPSGETIGTVGGAVAGGVLGSAATGGSTVGTIGGAIVGGAVGNRVGDNYDEKKGRR
jgi:osmotically inducible lipoprotein OsmB